MPRLKILYIGNDLFKKTMYPTTMETLSNLFTFEGVIVIKKSNKSNKLLRLTDMVFNTIKTRNKVDVILIDTYSTLNFYYALLVSFIARIINKPYIPILHGGDLPKRIKKSARLSRHLFNNAFVNVSPSNYLKTEFEKQGYKTICIPNTFDANLYSFTERKELRPRLLFVRAFAAIYNPEMAIRVLQLVKTQYPEARLCMVGPDRDGSITSVKQLAKNLNLFDAVTFTGTLTKKQWRQKSLEYDIFINTSNIDNMPVSVIEAMALGLPIVSTNPGGLKYLISNNEDGFLVKVNDHEAMASIIFKLLKNGSGDLTQKARLKAESYQWQNVKQKWFSLFNEL